MNPKDPGAEFTRKRKCEIYRKLLRHNAIFCYDVITYNQLYSYDFYVNSTPEFEQLKTVHATID